MTCLSKYVCVFTANILLVIAQIVSAQGPGYYYPPQAPPIPPQYNPYYQKYAPKYKLVKTKSIIETLIAIEPTKTLLVTETADVLTKTSTVNLFRKGQKTVVLDATVAVAGNGFRKGEDGKYQYPPPPPPPYNKPYPQPQVAGYYPPVPQYYQPQNVFNEPVAYDPNYPENDDYYPVPIDADPEVAQ